jgi:hypothetical protein
MKLSKFTAVLWLIKLDLMALYASVPEYTYSIYETVTRVIVRRLTNNITSDVTEIEEYI